MEVTTIPDIRERNDRPKDKQPKHQAASIVQGQMVQKFTKELGDSAKQSDRSDNAERAATDRAELSKLLHISDTQLSYITNAEAGHGLLRTGGSIVPFVNTIPRGTELYKLMTTTPGESQ